MNIAICDDIKAERERLTLYLVEYTDDKIFKYEDGNLLIDDHLASKFDIIFLDILMPTINGIDVATKIRAYDKITPIVFLTSTKEFAVESYRVLAFDYLLKPIKKEELAACMDRFLKLNHVKKNITINYLGVKTKILLSSIVYFESDLRKLIIHMIANKEIIIYGKLSDFFSEIEDGGFCRCHKSFVVNLNYVSNILGDNFNLDTGEQIKISRPFLNNAKKSYLDFMLGKDDFNV